MIKNTRRGAIERYLKERKVSPSKIRKYQKRFGKDIYFKSDVDNLFGI